MILFCIPRKLCTMLQQQPPQSSGSEATCNCVCERERAREMQMGCSTPFFNEIQNSCDQHPIVSSANIWLLLLSTTKAFAAQFFHLLTTVLYAFLLQAFLSVQRGWRWQVRMSYVLRKGTCSEEPPPGERKVV